MSFETDFNDGLLALRAGKRSEARTQFESATELRPESADALLCLAWTTDELEQAKRLLEKANELQPDHKLVRTYLDVVEQMTLLQPCSEEESITETAEKPKAEEPKAEEPKAEEPKAEKPKAEKPKAEKPKAEKPKAEEPKAESISAEAQAERQRAAAAFAFLANKNKPKVSDDPTTKTTPVNVEKADEEEKVAAEIQSEIEELNQDVKSTINAPQETSQPANAQVPTVCKGTVLVVDDSPTVRKLVSMTLRSEGYEMQTAEDGIEAMKVLVESTPDLILLDINMPRMDGYKLCKLIKGHPDTSSIPVVMLSGKDGMFDKLRGKLVGCNDYISKPFETADLLSCVAEQIERVAVS